MTFTDYSRTAELLPLPPPWLPAIQILTSPAPWVIAVPVEDSLEWLDDYAAESAWDENT